MAAGVAGEVFYWWCGPMSQEASHDVGETTLNGQEQRSPTEKVFLVRVWSPFNLRLNFIWTLSEEHFDHFLILFFNSPVKRRKAHMVHMINQIPIINYTFIKSLLLIHITHIFQIMIAFIHELLWSIIAGLQNPSDGFHVAQFNQIEKFLHLVWFIWLQREDSEAVHLGLGKVQSLDALERAHD